MIKRHVFDVELEFRKSRVWIDGVEMRGVRDIKIDQSLDSPVMVTIQFMAEKVVTRKSGDELPDPRPVTLA